MKITDLQLNESLTQEGMWDSLKGKLARTLAQPMRQRQEPVMTAEPAPAVWKNARNPGAPAATSPQAAAPSTAPADVEPEEPAPAFEPAAAVNTRPKGSGFLTRLGQEFRGRAQQIGQEFRGRAQQNQVNAANEEMVNARVNAWKQASQGLDPNNTRAYQTALKTWAQKNFPSADPAVIDQAAASVTPTGWGSNSQQVQAITDIFNNHITNKQIGKTVEPATPDFSKALMGQNAGYGKVTMNAPTGASMNIPKATPGASVPGAKPTAPAAAPATASNVMKMPGMEKYAKQPSWADPKSKDYVGRREVTRRQQAQTTAKPATATGTNATPTSAPNPLGQMANTMRTYAPPETTSTGGTLTQTPTGQVHKASATNPNAASTQPAAPEVTKVTTGGPTPDERAKLDQRIQQLAQKPALVQKESFTRDFGAMLWTKMRDSK